MKRPTLKLTFNEPMYGYWDGGKKSGGEFHPQPWNGGVHPGKDCTIKWGCFDLNFWFNCGSGRSWKEAVAIAKRRLQHICQAPATIEIIHEEVNDALD